MKLPLILGHRGASAEFTENTIAAFERALAVGADGVELDVRLCGSGELVIYHDPDLHRLTGRADRLLHTPLTQLRRIDLGGHRIPTLDEVFEALPEDFLINIEVKTDGYRVPRGLLRALIRRLGQRRIHLSSFHPAVVAALRFRVPHIPCGLLFWGEQGIPLRNGWPARWVRPTAVHPHAPLLTPRSVAHWRRHGYQIHTWTVDHPGELARLVRLGVDGIIANDPATARQHVERAAAGV